MKLQTISFALVFAAGLSAQNHKVDTYRYAGPFVLDAPLMIDTVNINGKHFNENNLIETALRLDQVLDGRQIAVDSLPLSSDKPALHLVAFNIKNDNRTKATINVKGVKDYRLYVDGNLMNGREQMLLPSMHQVVVKVLTRPENHDTLSVDVTGEVSVCATSKNQKRVMNLLDLMHGRRLNGVKLSPDGKYMVYNTYTVAKGGHTTHQTTLRELATGRETRLVVNMSWLPRTSRLYYQRKNVQGANELVTVDPATLVEEVMATDFPDGYFRISPTEDFFVYSLQDEGPRKGKDVYEILDPDDRMNGWRNRTRLSVYTLATGLMQPVTFGRHNVTLSDISPDGKSLLVQTTERRLTQRPTTLNTYMVIDLATMTSDTLVLNDGFMRGAYFSPDGKQVLFKGAPEAFDCIGKNVREGQTPNMYDIQMYLMDLTDKSVRPLTKYFNPSVGRTVWSCHDRHIYFTAEDKDCQHIFRMNPQTGEVYIVDIGEEYVSGFDVAQSAPVMAAYGQSLSNTARLYTTSTKNQNEKPFAKSSQSSKRDASVKQRKSAGIHKIDLILDCNEPIFGDVQFGAAEHWEYVTSRGDTLTNTYVLPPYFDASRKYPMIVYYYGGCTPTSRFIDSPYSAHLLASLGYVVLVVNPSGAIGFGQEFSARHVNTAGEGVAEDIIESAKTFCAMHDYVNVEKVGCIGASYGGFMTQYIQTKTDFFAAAISHAGISDHTSYWGEGNWGYSYSEVSMANSYPWKDRTLYVDHSPLYNADKIHTPLLFLHGVADTNVPVGESIQMFTALKLLGRPTAFVAVDAQDHHITDYNKRQKWQETIFAWFARYLQDTPDWWQELYPSIE